MARSSGLDICPECDAEMVGVEYPYGSRERYDGISEWLCVKCEARVGRWTRERIPAGMVESRYGARGLVAA